MAAEAVRRWLQPEHRDAQALLIAAFPDGQIPPLNIDVESDPTQVAVASAIRDQLRKVGIRPMCGPKPFQEYRDS